MSMESHTCLFGVIRPSADSCDERGKWLKSEPELQPEPELKSEPELPPELKLEPELAPELKSQPKQRQKYEWELKRFEDLVISDFSVYDDDIKPFVFKCVRFTYKNKAQIKKDKEIRVARAKHKRRSRNLSPFDAITPPRKAEICYGVIPLSITDDLRLKLTPLCKLALEQYNAKNQGANFVLADIVKTTWRPGGIYYITFQAQKQEQEDPSDRPVIIFQAHVWNKRPGPPEVVSCAIKT